MGWRIAEAEDKRRPFAAIFNSLGVRFDLTRRSEAIVVLANKEGRVEDIQKAIRALHSQPIVFKP